MDEQAGTIEFSERAIECASHVHTLLVPTTEDDSDNSAYPRARRAALELARRGTVRVVLYDRSDERWTDTPNPEGPFAIDEIERDRRPHLVDQMRDFAEAGIDVRAWYASVPALTRVLAAVQTLGADAVLVPESLDDATMMDRLQPGGAGDMVSRVLDQNVDDPIHVFVVSDDGRVDVSTTVDRTDRSQAAPSEAT
jgi:hypothetical protein